MATRSRCMRASSMTTARNFSSRCGPRVNAASGYWLEPRGCRSNHHERGAGHCIERRAATGPTGARQADMEESATVYRHGRDFRVDFLAHPDGESRRSPRAGAGAQIHRGVSPLLRLLLDDRFAMPDVVVRRFNAPMRFRDIVPIRASMYLLALINTNLGQGGVAYYLHRKAKIPFLEALGSILFIALMEIYQLFLFSTLGVIFYRPTAPAQIEIVKVLRVAYVIAWMLLVGIIALFAMARRNPSL